MKHSTAATPKDNEAQAGQRGQSLAEYGLLIVIVGIALVAIINLLGPAIEDLFEDFAGSAPLSPPSLAGYTPPPTYTPMITNTPGPSPTNSPTPTNTPTPTPSPKMHIADLDDESFDPSGSTWTARARILVLDTNNNAVAEARVVGTFAGTDEAACTTDFSGRCSVTADFGNGVHNVAFTVETIGHETFVYDGSLNSDPDGDSDGTVITLQRP